MPLASLGTLLKYTAPLCLMFPFVNSSLHLLTCTSPYICDRVTLPVFPSCTLSENMLFMYVVLDIFRDLCTVAAELMFLWTYSGSTPLFAYISLLVVNLLHRKHMQRHLFWITCSRSASTCFIESYMWSLNENKGPIKLLYRYNAVLSPMLHLIRLSVFSFGCIFCIR